MIELCGDIKDAEMEPKPRLITFIGLLSLWKQMPVQWKRAQGIPRVRKREASSPADPGSMFLHKYILIKASQAAPRLI